MIRFAQVVKVNPATRRLDLVDMDSGAPIGGAVLLSHDGSTDGGTWNVPSVPTPANASQTARINPSGRTIIAAYELAAGGRAVVHGFAHFMGAQIVFTQQDRQISRHAASGAYTTTAPDGSFEVWHPSGSYFRIGTGAHEPLAPLAADGNWVTPPVAAEPTVTLSTPHFSLVVPPGGAAVMTFTSLKMVGPVEIDGTVLIKSTLEVDSTVKITGDASIDGRSFIGHDHTNGNDGGNTGPVV
jgi:hypothetical protein